MRCFDSCFSESAPRQCASTDSCNDKCGITNAPSGFIQALPGFIVTECASSVERCLWAEFVFERPPPNSFNFTFSVPFGCEGTYTTNQVQSNIGNSIKFEDGVNIFSCFGDGCNTPPESSTCTLEEALIYTEESVNFDSGCFINQSGSVQTEFPALRENRFRILNNNNQIVQGNFLNRCVNLNAAEVRDIQKHDINNLRRNLDIITCDECEAAADCDINQDVTAESSTLSPTITQISLSPTSSPTTNQPSSTPTIFPTTTEPSMLPTIFPTTTAPSTSPTLFPTSQPTTNTNSAPTFDSIEPTSSPFPTATFAPSTTDLEGSGSPEESIDVLAVAVGSVAVALVLLAFAIVFFTYQHKRPGRKLSATPLVPGAEVVRADKSHDDIQVHVAVAAVNATSSEFSDDEDPYRKRVDTDSRLTGISMIDL